MVKKVTEGIIHIEGLQHSLRYLNKTAPKELRVQLARDVKNMVKKHTVPKVKEFAPKDTGKLSKAVAVQFVIRTGRIALKLGSKRAWYTRFVYYGHKTRGPKRGTGTGEVPARKYAYAAVVKTYDQMLDGYMELLNEYAKAATKNLNYFGKAKK